MSKRVLAAAMTAGLVLVPAAAAADVVLTPFLGVSFKGDLTSTRTTWGGSFLLMGGGYAGIELDFTHTPDFYQDAFSLLPEARSNVTTAMANVVLGLPIGGQHGPGVRPYVVGGVGLMRSRVDAGDLFDDVTTNDLGISAGAGFIVFFNDHVGVRGDLRYFRSLQDTDVGDGTDFRLGSLDFWRASAGLSIRF